MEDLISIREYELNKQYIEDFIETGNNTEQSVFFLIKYKNYQKPLLNSGNYKKALKVNFELQNSVQRIEGKTKYFKQYVQMLSFDKARCLHHLGKYNESLIIFKGLVISSLDNNLYANWYRANVRNQIDEFFAPIMYVSGGIYVILLIIEYSEISSDTFFLQNLFFLVAILSLAISYFLKKRVDKNPLPTK